MRLKKTYKKKHFFRVETFFQTASSRTLNYSPSCRSNILIHVVRQTAGRVRARALTEIGKPSASFGHPYGKLVFQGGGGERGRMCVCVCAVREIEIGERKRERERKRRFKISQSSGKRYSGPSSWIFQGVSIQEIGTPVHDASLFVPIRSAVSEHARDTKVIVRIRERVSKRIFGALVKHVEHYRCLPERKGGFVCRLKIKRRYDSSYLRVFRVGGEYMYPYHGIMFWHCARSTLPETRASNPSAIGHLHYSSTRILLSTLSFLCRLSYIDRSCVTGG